LAPAISLMAETIWIARHGSRQDFVDPEWHKSAVRPYDPPLSAAGFRQAERVAERLKNERISGVFSSPFLRCIQTAAIVAASLRLPVRIEQGLSEWLNPEWFPSQPQVLKQEEILQNFQVVDPYYRSRVSARYPETGDQVLARTGAAIRELAVSFPGTLLVVGHGATVYGGIVGMSGRSFEETVRLLGPVHYCCLSKLVKSNGLWNIECAADVSHLAEGEGGERFY
jgi:broad specificity phosphatase PhoE